MAATTTDLDAFWLVLNAQNVFLMQTGFLLLEVGCVRAQHAKAICVKNACDFLIVTFAWLILGYPLAFGSPGGMFGELAKEGSCGAFGLDCKGMAWANWFFQWSFASATCTIVSGAGAERCSFQGYICSTTLLSMLVYPAVVHWVWCTDGWLSNAGGGDWPKTEFVQMVDFAGSGVVHLTGGCGAIAMAWSIGARDGRFSKDGTVNSLTPHNLVLSCSGAMFLMTGWFGFNGGSTLAASNGGSVDAARICVITAIGAAAGGVTALFCVWWKTAFIQLEALMNGILAGLVSITAGAHCFTPGTAVLAGFFGGLVYIGSSNLMLYVEIDDPLDAGPIHGACGAWGLLAVGLFANEGGVKGAFFGNGELLQYQIIGMLVIMLWTFGTMLSVFGICNAIDVTILRVPIDIELAGDVILYGGSAYPGFQGESAPPSGNLAVVITDVQDSAALWDWSEDIMSEACDQHFELLRSNILRFNGFEFMDECDSLSIVFHTALDAMRFGLISQEDLVGYEWSDALIEHPAAARDGLYAGLRVRFVCEVGHATKFLNPVTNRLSYDGEVVAACKWLEKNCEDGGVTIITTNVVQELQEKHGNRLYELGQYHMQDLGSFDMDKGEDGVDNIALVQIMPMSLHERPAGKISAPRQALGYSGAPGVGEPEGTPVAIIFCTITNDSGGDDGEKIASDNLAMNCNKNGGYVTKNSQGVCLLAFHTAEDGVGFLNSMAAWLIAEPKYTFKAGLHLGPPSSIAPNKMSGRADYLGPPVNTAARLLSLAGDKGDLFTRGLSACAISGAAWANIAGGRRECLESQGKFQLKGVEEEMEAFALKTPTGAHATRPAEGAMEAKEE